MLIEVVEPHAALAVTRLQAGPGPGLPAESGVAGEVAGGLAHLAVGLQRIGGEEGVGIVLVAGADLVLVAATAEGEAEAQAFVGVVADKDIDIIVFPGLIEFVLVVRNHVTVGDGPAARTAEAAHDGLGFRRTHLLQRVVVAESGLSPVRIRFLGDGEGLHVLARIGLRVGRAEGAAALGNRPLEQALGERRGAQHAHGDAAGGLAEDGHVAGVAAELGDIVLHPLQTGDLVEETIVAAHAVRILGRQFRQGQESELAHAVSHAHDDDALLGEQSTVVIGGCAAGEAAAVDPDHHGQFLLRALGRGPYVQVQAVFAAAFAVTLHRIGAEFLAFADAVPGHDGLGRLPAEIAHRRRGERNALVHSHVLQDLALDGAAGHFHLTGLGGAGPQAERCRHQIEKLFHDYLNNI